MSDAAQTLDAAAAKYTDYPQKWQKRFAFYDTYGDPDSATFKAAFKSKDLPNKQKRLINFNWLAFFFSIIYLFILGLWKHALVWIGIWVVFMYATMFMGRFSEMVANGGGAAIAVMIAMSVNFNYYKAKIRQQQDWNPVAGVRWF